MPVDFPEPRSKPVPTLFSTSDGRGFLSSVPLVFLSRRKAPGGVSLEQCHVVDTVDNVLTYLAQRVDPMAPGTPSCCHHNHLAEVIGILCLLNDARHLQ